MRCSTAPSRRSVNDDTADVKEFSDLRVSTACGHHRVVW
jgi:hypothetical protein